jgi:hypothetical protein
MLAWFLVALLGCDPYNEAAQKDTIEAYEAYLATSPSGVGLERATFRLEELMLARARETRALADYDALLTRFPKGVHADEAQREREAAMFDAASAAFTLEAWEAFLAAYPNPKEQRGPFAKKAVEALRYVATGVKLGEVRQREINLANDPAGPLDGWEMLMDVTNAGGVVEALVFRVIGVPGDLPGRGWQGARVGGLAAGREAARVLVPCRGRLDGADAARRDAHVDVDHGHAARGLEQGGAGGADQGPARGAGHARVIRLAAVALVAACRFPGAVDTAAPTGACPREAPEPGAVRVAQVVCSAQRLDSDGDLGDLELANAVLRAIVRHPQTSLTLPGVGGGTVVDVAPWGLPDVLREVVPIVGGGWLDVRRADVTADGLVLSGVVRPIPGRPAPGAGRRAEVRWRLVADRPILEVEGAEALWIHPAVGLRLVDGWLADDRVVVGHDAEEVEDLGGVIVAHGATRLVVAPVASGWAERAGDDRDVAGIAAEAERVELVEAGRVVGWLPVDAAGRFAGRIPASVDGLVAVASGRAGSAAVPPGGDARPAVGARGELVLTVGWPAAAVPRPLRASWVAADGRSGAVRLDPRGGTVPVGPGVVQVTVEAGPAWRAWSAELEVPADGVIPLGLQLDRAVISATHVAASLAWPAWRDRTVRSDPFVRQREAVAAGFAFVANVAEHEVGAGAAFLDDRAWITSADGVRLTSPAGWAVSSWPWRANANRSGSGAPSVDALGPVEALEVAWGGAGVDREVLVDLRWLQAVRGSWLRLPRSPDWVELGPPGPFPFVRWETWFSALSGGRFLRPAGPVVWLDVAVGNAAWGAADLTAARVLGRVCAGTGALVDLRVRGAGPGGVAPPAPADTDPSADTASPPPLGTVPVSWTTQPGLSAVDRLTLVTDGRPVRTFAVARTGTSWQGDVEAGVWLTGVAWSTTSDDWAVAMPVWIEPPGVAPVEPAAP